MTIKVENTKKLNTVIILEVIIASGITWICQMIWQSTDISMIWLVILGIELVISGRFDYSEIVSIDLEDKRIVLTRNSQSASILYQDIIEVQRITNYGKPGANDGYHRMKIVTKKRKYIFFTNSKEQVNNTPFEITELGDFYYKLKGHGVKCC